MSYIPEHHPEQKREYGNGEDTWIDLPIAWRTIRIHNLLEGSCKFVELEVRWGAFIGRFLLYRYVGREAVV